MFIYTNLWAIFLILYDTAIAPVRVSQSLRAVQLGLAR